MRKLLLFIVLFILVLVSEFPAFSQTSWVQMPSPSTTTNLYLVYFINAKTGFVAGGNSLYKTTDGANTWSSAINTGLSISYSIQGIYFTDSITGYLIGDVGQIYKSTNGGLNWTYQSKLSGSNDQFFSFAVPHNYNGTGTLYATGLFDYSGPGTGAGYSVASSPDFINWTPQTSVYSGGGCSSNTFYMCNEITKASFLSSSTGWGIGYSQTGWYPTIYRTINSGSSWTSPYTQTSTNTPFYDVFALGSNNAVAVGKSKTIEFTTDGVTWNSGTISGLTSIPYLTGVWFNNATNGYAIMRNNSSDIGILNTKNGGHTWNKMTAPGALNLWSINFPDTYTGYAVGNSGVVMKLSCANSLTAITPSGNQPLCTGTSVNLTAKTTAVSPVTYQWEQNGTNITGATSSIFQIPVISKGDSGKFNCIVSNSCGQLNSDTTTLSIAVSPAITTQPVNVSTCDSTTALFWVIATGSNLSYQWEENGVNLNDGGVYSGSLTSSLNISNVAGKNSNQYRCIVSGTCTPEVTSSAATLNLNSGTTVITSQPQSVTKCSGTSVNFSVKTQ